MIEIHERLFVHLQSQYPDLRFTLRKTDKGGRLRKGYWFLGTEDYLMVSFWQGDDWRNKTANINFCILANGQTFFEFVDKARGEKAAFFEKVAKPLGMKPKGKTMDRWQKNYPLKASDYIGSIDDFLQTDKILLDALISSNDFKLFAPIEQDLFDKTLKKIADYRSLIINRPTVTQDKPTVSPLRLKQLKLTNIKHFKALEIDFSERLTCLIGENGSGKTTILRAALFGLIGFANEQLVRQDAEKLENELDAFLSIEKAGNGRLHYAATGNIELIYNQNKRNDIAFRLLKEGIDDEGQLRKPNTIDKDDSNSDFDALDDKGNFKNLVICFSQMKSKEPSSDQHHSASLESDSSRSSLRDIYSLLYNEADISFEQVNDWIAQTFHKRIDSKTRTQAVKVIQYAFEIMTKITGDTVAMGDIAVSEQATPLIQTPNSPNGIPLDLVSQGYQNLIGWVGYLIKRLADMTEVGADFTQTPAICLIDEVDTYLHPKWQRKLLRVLVDSFPNVQFVVTTHSPQVVMNIDIEQGKIYRIENGQAIAVLFTEGRDANSINREVFGLAKQLPDYEKKLDDIYDLIDREEKTQATEKINFLKQKWGESDVDLHRAETFLEMI